MLLLLPVTHARAQRVAAARSPSCRHIVRPTAIRPVNVRVSNSPDPAPSVRPRAPGSEDRCRSYLYRVDVHRQLWPVSMRHGLGVRCNYGGPLTVWCDRLILQFALWSCYIEQTKYMLLRSWLFLVRSMWLIGSKTIVIVLTWHSVWVG